MTAQEEIIQFRELRAKIKTSYEQQVANLREEKRLMVEQYDELIAGLLDEMNLHGLVDTGAPKPNCGAPSDIAVKAYNFLRESAGTKFMGREVVASIGAVGAVPWILLRPFVEDGRVSSEGAGPGVRYWVEPTEKAE